MKTLQSFCESSWMHKVRVLALLVAAGYSIFTAIGLAFLS